MAHRGTSDHVPLSTHVRLSRNKRGETTNRNKFFPERKIAFCHV